jgi:hypothetical protein
LEVKGLGTKRPPLSTRGGLSQKAIIERELRKTTEPATDFSASEAVPDRLRVVVGFKHVFRGKR